MITESSLHIYVDAARELLAGNSIESLFSELQMPAVPDNIALIPINGVMTKADVCGGMGTRSLTEQVNQAAADPSKKSIILYFESVPGGQVDGTKVFADAVKAAATLKPVLSAISGMACSAAEWVSSQSTEVYATSATDQIGCIGVMARWQNSSSADVTEVISDLSPDKNAEFKDVQILKDMYLNPVAQIFQDAVKEGRGSKLKLNSEKVLSGGTFVAAAAKQNGLIDGIMSFDKIIQRANYLVKKQNKNTMSATKQNIANAENFPFKNVLAAAGIEALAPVDEGFAISEDALKVLDARIDALNTAESALNDATSTVATASEKITELNTSITAKDAEIVALTAKVAAYTGKPAPVVADPVAASDPNPNKNAKYLTSVDAEAARMAEDFKN